MAKRCRAALIALLLAGAAFQAGACTPPLVADDDGDDDVIVGEGTMPLRAQFGAEAGRVQAVPLRHLSGSVDAGARLEALRDDRPGGQDFEPVAMKTLDDGVSQWSFVLSGGTLAIAQTAPEYHLLDAVTVQTDPGASPAIARARVLAPATPALLVVNGHSDQQQGYARHTLLALVDGLLQPVWEGPPLHSFSTVDEACDLRRVEQALAMFTATSDRNGWSTIALGVIETEVCHKDGDLRRTPPRAFTTTLQFDAASRRYVGALSDLEVLNADRRGD